MKFIHCYFILLVITINPKYVLAQCIAFTYDAAGNRTQRNICPAPLPVVTAAEVTSLTEQSQVPDESLDLTEVRIIPNPSTGLYQLTSSGLPQETPLLVLDNQGHVVQQRLLGDGLIDISALADGLYVFRIATPTKIISKKVLKIQ